MASVHILGHPLTSLVTFGELLPSPPTCKMSLILVPDSWLSGRPRAWRWARGHQTPSPWGIREYFPRCIFPEALLGCVTVTYCLVSCVCSCIAPVWTSHTWNVVWTHHHLHVVCSVCCSVGSGGSCCADPRGGQWDYIQSQNGKNSHQICNRHCISSVDTENYNWDPSVPKTPAWMPNLAVVWRQNERYLLNNKLLFRIFRLCEKS